MLNLPKYLLKSLYISLFILVPVSILLVKTFQPLYYLLWVVMVGGYIYKHQVRISNWLQSINIPTPVKFIGLGIGAILLEEIFASFSMHLAGYLTKGSMVTFFTDVSQFWFFNLLTLPGLIIAWYFLLKRYNYSKLEIFTLAGLFGLFAEKVYLHVVAYPILGTLLVIPTVFTYGLLVLIPTLSIDHSNKKDINVFFRYGFGLIIPIIFSLPFLAVLVYLLANHPEFFPPEGFVG